MIYFERFELKNGLKLIVHPDKNTPLAAVNLLYNVGARDENPKKTGFAHLFEHLMFGGSVNIPDFDNPLQMAGGENNAFTNNDITNYYDTLPAENLETALWLESDRMMSLAFNQKSLDVQKSVVCEEFKEHYINQPYGDVWHKLSTLAYKVHPYQWPTIGKELSHVENATMADVKDFFYRYYRPNNAVIVIAGNVEPQEAYRLTEKWFGEIPAGNISARNLPVEPEQKENRSMTVKAKVPLDAIHIAFHNCARGDEEFYAQDLISDVLSAGSSSRFYQVLLKEKQLFSEIDAYNLGSLDKGLVMVSGKLVKGVKMEIAEEAINEQIDLIKKELVGERELQKVKNRIESNMVYSDINVLHRAMNLAFFELLGDASEANEEMKKYHAVSAEQIREESNKVFRDGNRSTLYYYAEN